MTGPMHKTCTTCGETKPIDGFYKHKNGVESRCKECAKECRRRYYESNWEKEREKQRRYYEENREKLAEKQRRYREANLETVREKDRRWREANQGKVRERRRRHYEEFKEAINAKNSARVGKAQELAEMFVTVQTYTPWTREEEMFLMADNGMTVYQKAIELGRTYGSVSTRRTKLLSKLNA